MTHLVLIKVILNLCHHPNRQLEERQMRKDRILNGALSVFKQKDLMEQQWMR